MDLSLRFLPKKMLGAINSLAHWNYYTSWSWGVTPPLFRVWLPRQIDETTRQCRELEVVDHKGPRGAPSPIRPVMWHLGACVAFTPVSFRLVEVLIPFLTPMSENFPKGSLS